MQLTSVLRKWRVALLAINCMGASMLMEKAFAVGLPVCDASCVSHGPTMPWSLYNAIHAAHLKLPMDSNAYSTSTLQLPSSKKNVLTQIIWSCAIEQIGRATYMYS